jgi:hypothetical protein
MTVNIDFTPQETAWINAQAQQQGLSPEQIIRQMVDAQLRNTAEASVAAPPPPAPVLDAKQQAAIAYLDARIAEGENATPEQVRQATEEFEELKRNLNANRAATGERRVFP